MRSRRGGETTPLFGATQPILGRGLRQTDAELLRNSLSTTQSTDRKGRTVVCMKNGLSGERPRQCNGRVLFVASVYGHLKAFHIPYIKMLQGWGYEVHAAAAPDSRKEALSRVGVVCWDVPFSRSPYSPRNIQAIKSLRALMRREYFDLIHVHTPVASFIGRWIAKRTHQGAVLYTAHGFHFYKGAPLRNWLIYYTAEKLAARWTDVLVTINKEDYSRALRSLRAGSVRYVPGVGLDVARFRDVVVDNASKRKEIGVPVDAFVLLSVGELNKNKNHETVIRAVAGLGIPAIHYVICGAGPLKQHLAGLARDLGLDQQVSLLGRRDDIEEIYKIADAFAFPSRREGLGLAALEAMASGLPIVTSNVHGIVDYSIDGVTGYTCEPTDVDGFACAIERLLKSEALRRRMGAHNQKAVLEFELDKALTLMGEIYRQALQTPT